MADTNFLASQELAVSTELVMPTPQAAELVAPTARRLEPAPVGRITGNGGDPSLDPGRIWRRATIPARRRVIYVGGPITDFPRLSRRSRRAQFTSTGSIGCLLHLRACQLIFGISRIPVR